MRGQMKIMQMSFMIIAIFVFFVLVGLFFLSIMLRDARGGASDLYEEEAVSSLSVVADMPELNYDSRWSMVVDEDKLKVMSGELGEEYSNFWPVASIGVLKIYPKINEIKKCPDVNCNFYEVWDSGQKDVRSFSSFVSICKRIKEGGSVYDRCEIGKLVVGMKIISSEA